MIADIVKFYAHARSLGEADVKGLSLGGFLDQHGYSRQLAEEHVLPMCAAIWSTTTRQMRDYPMRSFINFFSSHGLLSFPSPVRWRTVKGGSRAYVRAMVSDSDGRVVMRPAARRITRSGGLVVVDDISGATGVFTDVVIAAHADEALRLLGDASPDERRILGAFGYTPNTAILHDDTTLMPKRRAAWSGWNYIGSAQDHEGERPLCVSYWMNHLQSLKTRRQLFVTLNPPREPANGREIARFAYSHPLFDSTALAAQDQLWQLQGQRRTWFCGSYFGYGFHEDALQSGLAVARGFGVAPPWGDRPARIAARPEFLAQAAE
jgi:predicted NAD/FAD-binding protein